jgi:hypothetical protein
MFATALSSIKRIKRSQQQVDDLASSMDAVEMTPIGKDDAKEVPPCPFRPCRIDAWGCRAPFIDPEEGRMRMRQAHSPVRRESLVFRTYPSRDLCSRNINCWKESPCKYLFGHAEAGQGRVARHTFRSVFFHRGVGRERISQAIDENELDILEKGGILRVTREQVTSKV